MAERRRNRRKQANMPRTATPRRKTAAESRAERLKLWWQRIEHARTIRKDWEAKYAVDELAAMFLGDHDATLAINDTSEIHVNRFWPTIKAMLPGLVNQAPTFLLRSPPRSKQELTTEDAMIGESVLNAIARQDNNLEESAKLAALQAFWRIGVLKSVYDPSTEQNPQHGAPIFVNDAAGLPLNDQQTGVAMQATDPETGAPLTEPDEIIKDEVYEWRWVNGCNMLFPDAGPDMRHWPWIAEEITVTLEAAQDDSRFPRALRDQLTPNTAERDGTAAAQQQMPLQPPSDKVDQEVTYVEVWDHAAQERLILIEGQSFSTTDFLIDGTLPEGVEDNPYAILAFNPIIDPEPSPWPLPMVWNWKEIQRELNIRRNQMTAAAGRSARKIGYDESTFADVDEAVKALDSTRDMEAIKLNDVNKPWVTIPDPGSPPEITRDYVILTDDWRTVTGQTGARLATPDSDTATEAVLSERAANLRDVLERRVVQNWLAVAGKKMLQQLKATLTLGLLVKLRGFNDREFQEYMTRIYGPQTVQQLQNVPGLKRRWLERFGQERWQRITHEELQFEAEVEVTPGSARARTLDMERQQLLSFAKLIAEAPILTLFPEFLRTIGDTFEFVDDRVVEEMALRGPQIMQQLAQGRAGGGGGSAGGAQPSAPGTPQAAGTRLAGAFLNGGG